MRKRREFTNAFKSEAVRLAERGDVPVAPTCWPATSPPRPTTRCGRAMRSALERGLTLRALEIAQRRPAPGLIHHSERGFQYACGDYQSALNEQAMVPSMSRKGDCWDNAPKESFFGTLKCELGLHEMRLPRQQAHRTAFEHIEIFYNRQRLHWSLGYLSPADFEMQSSAKAA